MSKSKRESVEFDGFICVFELWSEEEDCDGGAKWVWQKEAPREIFPSLSSSWSITCRKGKVTDIKYGLVTGYVLVSMSSTYVHIGSQISTCIQ